MHDRTVIAALLLLGAVLLAWRIHVLWGRADLRVIELQSAEQNWDEIDQHQAEQQENDRIADEAARKEASRSRSH